MRVNRDRRRQYMARYAWRLRQALFNRLGRQCAICKKSEEEVAPEPLEFDHPLGRDYLLRRLNRWQRAIQYGRDLQQGNLRVLCASCNRGGSGRRYRKGEQS